MNFPKFKISNLQIGATLSQIVYVYVAYKCAQCTDHASNITLLIVAMTAVIFSMPYMLQKKLTGDHVVSIINGVTDRITHMMERNDEKNRGL